MKLALKLSLFPTGWGAAFGAITAFVQAGDHIVIDQFAHASLRQGAQAATGNVAINRHLDTRHVRELVAQITAMQRELATQTLRKTHQTPERKSHDNYTKLAETQQFERRLIAMIEDRETTLGQLATFSDQQRVQKELAALEGRLMRCRQALAKIERQIERQEKGF